MVPLPQRGVSVSGPALGVPPAARRSGPRRVRLLAVAAIRSIVRTAVRVLQVAANALESVIAGGLGSVKVKGKGVSENYEGRKQ